MPLTSPVRLFILSVIAPLVSITALPAQTAQKAAVNPASLASNATANVSASKQTLVASSRSEIANLAGQPQRAANVSAAACCDIPGTGYTITPFSANDIYADAIIYPFSNAGNSGTIIRIGGGSTDTIYTIYTGTNPYFVGTLPYNTIPISSGYNLCFSFMPTTAWSWDIAAHNPGEDATAPGSGNILNAGTATVGIIYQACNAGSGWIITPPALLYGSTGTSPMTSGSFGCGYANAAVPGAMPGMNVVASPSLAFKSAYRSHQSIYSAIVSAPNIVTIEVCQANSGSGYLTPDLTWYNVTVTPY